PWRKAWGETCHVRRDDASGARRHALSYVYSGVTRSSVTKEPPHASYGEMRKARPGVAGRDLPAVQQRARPAHLRQRLAGRLADVDRAVEDDGERIPHRSHLAPGSAHVAGEGGAILLRRTRHRRAPARVRGPHHPWSAA